MLLLYIVFSRNKGSAQLRLYLLSGWLWGAICFIRMYLRGDG